jgi:hypothetical protein
MYHADIMLARWGHPGFAVLDDTGDEVCRSYLDSYTTANDDPAYPCRVDFWPDHPGEDGGKVYMTHADAARARRTAVLIAAGLNLVDPSGTECVVDPEEPPVT